MELILFRWNLPHTLFFGFVFCVKYCSDPELLDIHCLLMFMFLLEVLGGCGIDGVGLLAVAYYRGVLAGIGLSISFVLVDTDA